MIYHIIAVLVLFAIRLLFVWKEIRSPTPRRRTKPMSTMVVFGSGGHTAEMLELIADLDKTLYSPMNFVIATTDTTSARRIEPQYSAKLYRYHRIPRSREVGQSYWTSVASTLWSFVFSFWLVLRLRPSLVLCNGPGTCLPIAISALFLRIMGVCEGKLVFVESFCRVKSLSLTGKLLYPVADLFVVHWQDLHQKYPRSHLGRTFIDDKS